MNPNAAPFKPTTQYPNPIDLAVRAPLAPIRMLNAPNIHKMTVRAFRPRTLGEYDGMMTAIACAKFVLE